MLLHLFQQSSCLICNKTIGESPSGKSFIKKLAIISRYQHLDLSFIFTGAGLDCVFPFNFYGRTFTACTNFNYDEAPNLDPDAGAAITIWCATKVDKFGNYNPFGAKDLGFCDPRCEYIDEKKNFEMSTWDGLDEFLKKFPNYEPCYENCELEIVTLPSTTT